MRGPQRRTLSPGRGTEQTRGRTVGRTPRRCSLRSTETLGQVGPSEPTNSVARVVSRWQKSQRSEPVTSAIREDPRDTGLPYWSGCTAGADSRQPGIARPPTTCAPDPDDAGRSPPPTPDREQGERPDSGPPGEARPRRRHRGEPLLEFRSPSRQNAPFGEQPRPARFTHPRSRPQIHAHCAGVFAPVAGPVRWECAFGTFSGGGTSRRLKGFGIGPPRCRRHPTPDEVRLTPTPEAGRSPAPDFVCP